MRSDRKNGPADGAATIDRRSTSRRRSTAVFAAFLLCCCCCCCWTATPAIAADRREFRSFPVGVRHEYELHATVLAHEPGDAARPVGHRVVGRLSAAQVWSSSATGELLEFRVSERCSCVFLLSPNAPVPTPFRPRDDTRIVRGSIFAARFTPKRATTGFNESFAFPTSRVSTRAGPFFPLATLGTFPGPRNRLGPPVRLVDVGAKLELTNLIEKVY